MKVAFLFGAGAECGENNFNIPLGNKLMMEAFYDEKYQKCLQKYFSKSYFDNSYKYGKKKMKDNFFNNIFPLVVKQIRNSDRKDKFDQKYIPMCYNLMNKTDFNYIFGRKYDYKEEIQEQEKEKIKEQFYNLFKNTKSKCPKNVYDINKFIFFDANNKYIQYNISAGALLDSYFHSINNPKKFGSYKFNTIFYYYWSLYFAIVKYIIQSFKEGNDFDLFNEFLTENNELNCEYLLENLKDFTRKLYDIKFFSNFKTSYYACINEFLSKNTEYECVGVATTNYYKYASIIENYSGNNKNVIYLNGSLDLFEYPELLEVSKLKEYSENIFFPFIFGTSYVKPIVNSKQISSYANFNTMLEETDVLIIIGYNVNEDDNHINTFLHEFIMKGKRIFYINDEDNLIEKQKALRIDKKDEELKDKLQLIKVNYKNLPQDIIKKVFNEISAFL